MQYNPPTLLASASLFATLPLCIQKLTATQTIQPSWNYVPSRKTWGHGIPLKGVTSLKGVICATMHTCKSSLTHMYPTNHGPPQPTHPPTGL